MPREAVREAHYEAARELVEGEKDSLRLQWWPERGWEEWGRVGNGADVSRLCLWPW